MIADLADLGGLDAARVVTIITPLLRLVATAAFLIFRRRLGGRGWRGVGREKQHGREE